MRTNLRVGLVVPHIFMHREILPKVIFSPGVLALNLAEGLQRLGATVTLFTPGPVDTMLRKTKGNEPVIQNITQNIQNITADLSYFEQELAGRGDSYLDLLKKHPFTFITLARQVQAELVARALDMANRGELDLVHIYTNEEDIALPFTKLCRKPVVFTHHDPYNFLVKYKNVFPKYADLRWLSVSMSQRRGMPANTNWVGNIYHGADGSVFRPIDMPAGRIEDETVGRSAGRFIGAPAGRSAGAAIGYIVCIGRIIESKGTHLAIAATHAYNRAHPGQTLRLVIAGKHYAGKKDTYWQDQIAPEIDNITISYAGFVGKDTDKRDLLANAAAVIVPSTFQEPFGMVMIEALACGTPVIGLDSGAIPEVVQDGETGFVVRQAADDETNDESRTVARLAEAIAKISAGAIDRRRCRQAFEERFTLELMCQRHLEVYHRVVAS